MHIIYSGKNLKKVYNVGVQKSQKGAWCFRKKVTR